MLASVMSQSPPATMTEPVSRRWTNAISSRICGGHSFPLILLPL
jgi:hypothetical protein